jgi:hypothetical protein
MSRVVAGRITHRHEGELVVFHIGMTVNQWWRPDQWMPIFGEMPRMLRELMTDPDSGLLGSHILIGASGPYLVQYWSSIEKLYAYASAPASEHRPAWSRFNRRARSAPKAVGVWHETFLVERAESIYVSTPAMGLPAATEAVPIGSRNQHARQRFADGRTGATEAPEASA